VGLPAKERRYLPVQINDATVILRGLLRAIAQLTVM